MYPAASISITAAISQVNKPLSFHSEFSMLRDTALAIANGASLALTASSCGEFFWWNGLEVEEQQ
jgi:hypothetical protein